LTWRNGSGQNAGGVVQTWDKLNRLEPVTVRDGRNEAASAFGCSRDVQGWRTRAARKRPQVGSLGQYCRQCPRYSRV
jgi:hypothetical protein